MTKTALVLGAGGFIGSHMVTRLKSEGYWVRGVDLKSPEYSDTNADEFVHGDLTRPDFVQRVIRFSGEQGNFYHQVPKGAQQPFDEIYQYAADMGGAGYIFSGENDSDVMYNSGMINLNLLKAVLEFNQEKEISSEQSTQIFYSSSACMYPEYAQMEVDNPGLRESDAYPAGPDSEYGWEKLFSERLYLTFNRNHGIPVRVARFHNIYGPESTWKGGKEKSPAAMCRKVSYALDEDTIEVWGDGEQTRSFLYIDECIEATRRLMKSDFLGPVNIGSEEMVTINQLVETVAKVAKKKISINHVDGPLGVRGRNSNNDLIREKLDWDYSTSLEEGIRKTYEWICWEICKETYDVRKPLTKDDLARAGYEQAVGG